MTCDCVQINWIISSSVFISAPGTNLQSQAIRKIVVIQKNAIASLALYTLHIKYDYNVSIIAHKSCIIVWRSAELPALTKDLCFKFPLIEVYVHGCHPVTPLATSCVEDKRVLISTLLHVCLKLHMLRQMWHTMPTKHIFLFNMHKHAIILCSLTASSSNWSSQCTLYQCITSPPLWENWWLHDFSHFSLNLPQNLLKKIINNKHCLWQM